MASMYILLLLFVVFCCSHCCGSPCKGPSTLNRSRFLQSSLHSSFRPKQADVFVAVLPARSFELDSRIKSLWKNSPSLQKQNSLYFTSLVGLNTSWLVNRRPAIIVHLIFNNLPDQQVCIGQAVVLHAIDSFPEREGLRTHFVFVP